MPSRPSRPQRLRVWRGELKKTSGGLMRDDLVKNSKGKIVSRRKSKQAGEQNNLGVWLRSKGDKFGDKPAKPNKQQPKQAEAKPKVQKPKPKPKPILKEKPKPKPAPKPASAKPKEYGASKKDITVRSVFTKDRTAPKFESRRAKKDRLAREQRARDKARWG